MCVSPLLTEGQVTVWDTSGLPHYQRVRPLVYQECGVVAVCYSGPGRAGVPGWVREVRRTCLAAPPILLLHTQSDITQPDPTAGRALAERMGAAHWESTSALTGKARQSQGFLP